MEPTLRPSELPTGNPTFIDQTSEPTLRPSELPTGNPTPQPTSEEIQYGEGIMWSVATVFFLMGLLIVMTAWIVYHCYKKYCMPPKKNNNIEMQPLASSQNGWWDMFENMFGSASNEDEEDEEDEDENLTTAEKLEARRRKNASKQITVTRTDRHGGQVTITMSPPPYVSGAKTKKFGNNIGIAASAADMVNDIEHDNIEHDKVEPRHRHHRHRRIGRMKNIPELPNDDEAVSLSASVARAESIRIAKRAVENVPDDSFDSIDSSIESVAHVLVSDDGLGELDAIELTRDNSETESETTTIVFDKNEKDDQTAAEKIYQRMQSDRF